MPPPTSATRAITETERTRRVRDGRVARDRAVRRRHAGRCHREQPPDAAPSRSAPTRRSRCRALNFGGDAGRHRRQTGARFRRAADHQHRHRAPQGRRRPDRRGHHDGADGLLHRCHRRARCHAARRGDTPMSRLAVVALRRQRAGHRCASTTRSPSSTRPCRTVSPYLVDLVEQGWNLVVSHGNGPQVGFILRRSELAIAEVAPGAGGLRRRPTRRARSATCSSRR